MPLLTIEEAAGLLRVKVTWLYERTRTNEVPHVKLGTGSTLEAKDVLLDVRDEDEFLAGHAPDVWFCPVAQLESIR